MTRLDPITTPRHELRAEKARRNKEAALAAFIAKKVEIDDMLARLQVLSDEHFNCQPEDVGWATVGTLDHYASLLRRITLPRRASQRGAMEQQPVSIRGSPCPSRITVTSRP